VPTFFATLIITSDPGAYGFRLTDPIEPEIKRIDVEGPLSLRAIAKAAKVNEASLRELNPVLRKGVVPRGMMVSIRVPSRSAEKIARVLSRRRTGERTLTGGM
jgi:hypothetical protein